MEDGDPCGGTECDHGVIHMPAEVVELRLGLAEPLDEVLRWGHHPVADVAYADSLLLAKHLVREELPLDLDTALEGGVVHAFGASERPAVPALALAVMLGIVGTCGVHYSSGGGADEAASLPVGTTEVVGGHAPRDVLAVGLRSFLTLVPDVILRMKSKVLYGRIRGVLHRQVPHIGSDGVLRQSCLDGEALPLLHLEVALESAEASVLEPDVVVFDLHVISDDGTAEPSREGGRRSLGCARRDRAACLAPPRSRSSLGVARDRGGCVRVRDNGRVRRGGRRGKPGRHRRHSGSSCVGDTRSTILTLSFPSHAP